MIAAAKLDRVIRIERAHRVPGVAGSETIAWTSVGTVPAELLQSEVVETRHANGVKATNSLSFRIRFFADITTEDRVIYSGQALHIRAIKEIGRYRVTELHCEGGGNA
jgi:SPP1 family predicted phage head-tail adaptor